MRDYQVWLEDTLIGTTRLEGADPPMGGVFGEIQPIIEHLTYGFIKTFYASRQIGFDDSPDIKLIATRATDKLRVVTPDGITIESLGNQIVMLDGEGCEVFLEGVGYPFYAEEFAHHCADYDNLYKDWYRGTVDIWGKTYFLKKI